MSNISAVLSLPYIQPSQAQKHVTHNLALQKLDAIVQLTVVRTGATEPPAAPTEGEVYALDASPVGDWAGQTGTLAQYDGTAWTFVTPKTGWRAWDQATSTLKVWDGGDWVTPGGGTQNLDGVGVATTSDAVNRLSVASEATLLSHAGAGHQLKVNKASVADTATLLFQNAFSGRAEMGLAGDDDFAIKVSSDGATWNTGLAFSGAHAFMGVGTQTPDKHLHVLGPDNAEIRVETEEWSTAVITAKGRRTGDATEIAKLRFINQENVQGADSAEASIAAVRDTANGIKLEVNVSDAGSPVNAFTVERDGHLDQLRFAPRAAPANPVTGQVYFDASSSKLRCFDGTVWQDLF